MNEKQPRQDTTMQLVFKRLLGIFQNNWKLKVLSLLLALTIWGTLISEDASLTREKTFVDVPITITGVEALQRSGLIVTKGLDNVEPIRMRAEVPQKVYEGAMPSSYSVRVDVSRITSTGAQTLPVLASTSVTYGAVSWLSQTELKVQVEEYITRRRIPVRLQLEGSLPAGYYATGASVDPGTVVISGPRSLVEKVVQLSAVYRQSDVTATPGTVYTAVPYALKDAQGNEIASKHISVTSENVLLDTLLVEQMLYPMKAVDINLTGVVKGQPAEGFRVASIKADPTALQVAALQGELDSVDLLDLSTAIDVTGLNESIIRAVRVEKPAGAVYLSDSAIYVTIEILPEEDLPASGNRSSTGELPT